MNLVLIKDLETEEIDFRHELTDAELFHWITNIKEITQTEKHIQKFLNDLIDWEKRLIEEEKSLIRMTELYQEGIIRTALIKSRGNKSEAARLLQVGRTTLHELIKRFEIPDNPGIMPQTAPLMEKLIDSIEYRLHEKELEPMNEFDVEKNIQRTEKLLSSLHAQKEKKRPTLRVANAG